MNETETKTEISPESNSTVGLHELHEVHAPIPVQVEHVEERLCVLLRVTLGLQAVGDKLLLGHLAVSMFLVELAELLLDLLLGHAQLPDQTEAYSTRIRFRYRRGGRLKIGISELSLERLTTKTRIYLDGMCIFRKKFLTKNKPYPG